MQIIIQGKSDGDFCPAKIVILNMIEEWLSGCLYENCLNLFAKLREIVYQINEI